MKMIVRSIAVAGMILTVWAGGALGKGQAASAVIIIDNGTQPLPAAVEHALVNNPAILCAVAWPPAVEPSETVRLLVQRGQVLPLMTIGDEPALSVIDEHDAADIVAAARRAFTEKFPDVPAYIYLRSGICTASLPSRCRAWGVDCVIVANTPLAGPLGHAARVDDTLLLLAGVPGTLSAGDLGAQVAASTSPVTVISLRGSFQMKPSFLVKLHDTLRGSSGRMVTLPSDGALAERIAALPYLSLPGTLSEDVLPADLWHTILAARVDIETYALSGQALARNLAMAREELFHAYALDYLRRVSTSADPAVRQGFTAGMRNIYRLIGMPFPEAGIPARPVPTETEGNATFSLVYSSDTLAIHNAPADSGGPHLEAFSVNQRRDSIVYHAAVSSASWADPVVVDVYIDMNNQRGAGATALLPGIDAFVPQEDGWEYAVRMERYQCLLYRAARGVPVLIKTFKTIKPFSIEIPRAELRGNPLLWRYQAVVAARPPDAAAWVLCDFLCADAGQRSRLRKRSPIEIPLIDGRKP